MKTVTRSIPGYELTLHYGFGPTGTFRFEEEVLDLRSGRHYWPPTVQMYEDVMVHFPELSYLLRWAQACMRTDGRPDHFWEDCLYYREVALGRGGGPSVFEASDRIQHKMAQRRVPWHIFHEQILDEGKFRLMLTARLAELAVEFRADMEKAGLVSELHYPKQEV